MDREKIIHHKIKKHPGERKKLYFSTYISKNGRSLSNYFSHIKEDRVSGVKINWEFSSV